MSITIHDVQTTGTDVNQSTHNISVTLSSDVDKLLFLWGHRSNRTITSLAYNGDALTEAFRAVNGTDHTVAGYYLDDPDVGAAYTLQLVLNGNSKVAGVIYGISGGKSAVQDTSTGTGSGNPSLSVNLGVAGVAFDAVKANSTYLTVGSGQTSRYEAFEGTTMTTGLSTETGHGSTTMSWSQSGSADFAHGALAVEEKPIGGNRIFGGVFIERAKELLHRPVLERFPIEQPETPLGWNKKGGLLIPQGV